MLDAQLDLIISINKNIAIVKKETLDKPIKPDINPPEDLNPWKWTDEDGGYFWRWKVPEKEIPTSRFNPSPTYMPTQVFSPPVVSQEVNSTPQEVNSTSQEINSECTS